MSAGRNSVLICFAIVGVFLIGLVRFARWSTWVSLVMAVIFIAVGLFLIAMRSWSAPSPPQEPAFMEVTAPPPAEHRKENIINVLLPSKREYYYFVFSATVLWSPVKAVGDTAAVNMAALAIDAILRRAREITEQRDPGHSSLIRHEVGRALAEMCQDATGYVRAMAESVQLILPDRDQERLDKLAAVHKEEDIWEYERRHEQSKREYLSGDVLKDPGSAVVWWFSKNDDQVEKAVQNISLLAELSRAANNLADPEPSSQGTPNIASSPAPNSSHADQNGSDTQQSMNEKSVAEHFDAFLHALNLPKDDPGRVLFARRVADLAAKHGRQEAADEMMNRFDTAESAEHSGETLDGD